MPRKRRLPATQVNEEQAENLAIGEFLGDISPDLNPDAVKVVEVPATAPPPYIPPEPVEPYTDPNSLLNAEAHDYLKRQVLIEMYGTDQPSKHDREILSIKERIQRYAR